ncbi:MAG TPA: alfa-L-rhamnosidase RamA, partial [Lachnospiraceae bacterium]|nr:alfa-L-rhamnosidase RamA [Lachnospiraceae bacterium]
MKLTELKVNHISAPLGFKITPLSFSWKVEDAGKAKKQKWARLCIFCGENTVFDSGEDAGADSLDYQVDLKLLPRTHYSFSVEVMADNGETATASGSFETGKMDEKWTAQWITPDMDAGTPAVLKKTFIADGKGQARLYICGLG